MKEESIFNYRNLNDVEFEELCKDIMKRKLGVKLKTFRKGKDGGIDLQDNEKGNNITLGNIMFVVRWNLHQVKVMRYMSYLMII